MVRIFRYCKMNLMVTGNKNVKNFYFISIQVIKTYLHLCCKVLWRICRNFQA